MSIFQTVKISKPKTSKFNLSHEVKLTTDFGKLIPIYVEDVVPGDRIKNLGANIYVQMMPMLAPILDQIEVRCDFFFVPNRLLWDNWQEFITRGVNGTDAPVMPYLDLSKQQGYNFRGMKLGSLWDYLGLPPYIPAGPRFEYGAVPNYEELDDICALPFRAYSLIYKEYYIDQNLQQQEFEDELYTGNGPDEPETHPLRYINLKKDYFTSALPWTQRGPEVSIPLSGTAPVSGVVDIGEFRVDTDQGTWRKHSGDSPGLVNKLGLTSSFGEGGTVQDADNPGDTFYHNHTVDLGQLDLLDGEADLSDASAVTVNELRRLTAVQRWFERNARAGSRYIEQILSHFGVRTPDYRLDRPEYLGGTKNWIGVSKVLQTSQSTETSPLGDFAGHGQLLGSAKARKYRVDEHGWIIGLMAIRPKNVYADGIRRCFFRSDTFDFFFPEFQHLGEQAIENRELYAYRNGNNPKGTFGYTPRYAEYKYHPSDVRGEMRNSLYYWHLARLFNSQPTLNANFISSDPRYTDYDRIFPVQTDDASTDHFIVDLQIISKMRRPMQRNPNPRL